MPALASLVAGVAGFRIPAAKEDALEAHVARRVRALALPGVQAYFARLEPGHPSRAAEIAQLADLLTSGETFFLRDAGQMQLLRERILPSLLARRRREGTLPVRVWSAACSTGEETYSLAMLAEELQPRPEPDELSILGTDIDPAAIARAVAGEYGPWSFRGCSDAFRERHFATHAKHWRVRPELRRRVRFACEDLLAEPGAASPGGYDLILCRNLFIYLEAPAAARLAARLAAALRDGGILMTGHGELHAGVPEGLAVEAHAESIVYRKSSRERATQERPPSVARASPGTRTPPRPPSASPRLERPDDHAMAWDLANAGLVEEAHDVAERLCRERPMDADVQFLLGVVSQALGRTQAARAALRRAIYLDPSMLRAHAHLEQVQRLLHENEAAERTRRTVARLRARAAAKGVPGS